MMDNSAYESVREVSSHVFNNALVLPVASVILNAIEVGATFTIPDLRVGLEGRVADNQIRDALRRVVATGAVAHLDSLGGSRADVWLRQTHSFWTFADELLRPLISEPETSGDKS